jgi:hypothetical protein
LVVRVVGKQREIGIAPPGGERAVAGNEHPMILAADND